MLLCSIFQSNFLSEAKMTNILKPQQQRRRSTHDVTTESISMLSVTSCAVKGQRPVIVAVWLLVLNFKPFHSLYFG